MIRKKLAALYEEKTVFVVVFALAKTKAQISCTVTAQLICTFVFATQTVHSLYFLNPKCQATNHFLRLYNPGRKPEDRVSRDGSNDLSHGTAKIQMRESLIVFAVRLKKTVVLS